VLFADILPDVTQQLTAGCQQVQLGKKKTFHPSLLGYY
jgi:hypothetical protein